MSDIDITGLDKAEVLSTLFNASKQQGMGFMDSSGVEDMTVEGAREILSVDRPLYFDYLKGRVMKVNLSEDAFSPALFDRDNGQGAAAAAIDKLRS